MCFFWAYLLCHLGHDSYWMTHQPNQTPANPPWGFLGVASCSPGFWSPKSPLGKEKTFPSTENHSWRPWHPLAAPEGAGLPLTANIFMFCWHFFSHSILMTNLSWFYTLNFKSRHFSPQNFFKKQERNLWATSIKGFPHREKITLQSIQRNTVYFNRLPCVHCH